MSRAKQVQIGGHSWQFQKDAIAFYKDILNAYQPGDTLTDEDFNDIYALVKNHPNSAAKLGSGVEKIVVAADEYGGQCFHVVRTDASIENFSYAKAVKGEVHLFTQFSQACRKAVEADMIQIKDDVFAGKQHCKCQETGVLLTKDQAHVDHRQPHTFSVIVDRFIEVNRINIESVDYVTEGQYGRIFADAVLSTNFRAYHKDKANLRIVSKDRNLRRSFMARARTQKKDLRIL